MSEPGAECLKHQSDWQYWERGRCHCLGCLRDSVQEAGGMLVALAGKVVRCEGLPSTHRSDWPKRITWAELECMAQTAEGAAKGWAVEMRKIADSISDKPRGEGR